MINNRAVLFVGLLAWFAALCGHAETTNLVEKPSAVAKLKGGELRKLGDPAPPITVQEWVKGKPVKFQPGTNIYVLVFCTLSRANELALTNLSGLQKQYRDKSVTVVAISDDPPEQLKAFVQIRGAEIDFTVAADDLARKTTMDYQGMFRETLLPQAYVVGTNGAVLWRGHPLRDDLGLVLAEITSGRYNPEAAQKKIIARKQMQQYLALAATDDPRTAKIGRLMLALRTNDAPALCDLAFQIASDPSIENRDVAVATAALDRAAQLATTNATDIAMTRAILLFQTGKEEAGLGMARQAVASAQTPEDKKVAQANLHAMEVRLAIAKTNQLTAPTGATMKTNQVTPPLGKP
jgi:peroxiredoxin